MYAVIKVGGKQEKVKPGDVVEVDFMRLDPGASVEFQPLVLVDDEGKSHYGKGLSRAKVVARLLGDKKGDKVKVFKYRPKSGYRRSQGHRQLLTLLEIQEVGLAPDRTARKGEEAAEVEEAQAKKPAGRKAAAKKPAGRKAAAKKPAAKKATGKKATAKKPAARKPAGKTPSAGKPAGGEPS